jgi:large subunit ribosomal protein L29
MELQKIRNLSNEELAHQHQVALGQNDGVKKIRQLRREIAQIKTVTRERELGIRGEANDSASTETKKGAR